MKKGKRAFRAAQVKGHELVNDKEPGLAKWICACGVTASDSNLDRDLRRAWHQLHAMAYRIHTEWRA